MLLLLFNLIFTLVRVPAVTYLLGCHVKLWSCSFCYWIMCWTWYHFPVILHLFHLLPCCCCCFPLSLAYDDYYWVGQRWSGISIMVLVHVVFCLVPFNFIAFVLLFLSTLMLPLWSPPVYMAVCGFDLWSKTCHIYFYACDALVLRQSHVGWCSVMFVYLEMITLVICALTQHILDLTLWFLVLWVRGLNNLSWPNFVSKF